MSIRLNSKENLTIDDVKPAHYASAIGCKLTWNMCMQFRFGQMWEGADPLDLPKSAIDIASTFKDAEYIYCKMFGLGIHVLFVINGFLPWLLSQQISQWRYLQTVAIGPRVTGRIQKPVGLCSHVQASSHLRVPVSRYDLSRYQFTI